MKINEKDFVEVEYTGWLKEENHIFDTTDEKLAKESGVYNPNMLYGPVIVCLGEHQLLDNLEKELIGKEVGKEYDIELSVDKAFGKKDPKLLKIVPTSVFKKEKIDAVPGLQINIDGVYGMIKTVSGGRTIVDFNHPYAGKELKYKVKALKIVNDTKDKIKGYLELQFHLKDLKVEVKEGKAIVTGIELPEEVAKELNKKLLELVPEIKDINYKKV